MEYNLNEEKIYDNKKMCDMKLRGTPYTMVYVNRNGEQQCIQIRLQS